MNRAHFTLVKNVNLFQRLVPDEKFEDAEICM
jgi:hypothetical protein